MPKKGKDKGKKGKDASETSDPCPVPQWPVQAGEDGAPASTDAAAVLELIAEANVAGERRPVSRRRAACAAAACGWLARAP